MAVNHPDVDSIFAESATYTATCLRVYRSLGYRVPEDVRLVGYGNRSLQALCGLQPTIVCEDTAAIAHEAVKLLIDRIEEGGAAASTEVVVPVSLLPGQTT